MSSPPLDQRIESLIAAATRPGDPRRYRRSPVSLLTNFLLPDGVERLGRITDISAGGAFILGTGAAIEDTIRMRIEKVGHAEGMVVRVVGNGFGLQFNQPRAKAIRLADTLTWLINGGEDTPERREADRFQQGHKARLTIQGIGDLPCSVLDISTTGAFLAVRERPPIGTEVRIGKQRAIVVRHEQGGIGVNFAWPTATE